MCGSKLNVFEPMARESIEAILAAISGVRVALIGDLCLDAYWKADMTRSELSRETPQFPLPIVEESYSPGAGGNAAANIAELIPKSIKVIGTIGQDWRADVLTKELASRGIGVSGIVRHPGRVTSAYIKPCRKGISELVYEDPRLDFTNYTPQPPDLDDAIVAELEKTAQAIDVLCVSDQFQYGCITETVRQKIVGLAAQGLKVVVDSRYRIGLFPDCILKPNELEGSAAVGIDSVQEQPGMHGYVAVVQELVRRTGSSVCMTLGSHGCLVAGAGALHHIPAVKLAPPLDICGAGDTFLAVFSCALATGTSMAEAAAIANLASSITVKKIGQTGTANRDEILLRVDERDLQ